MGPTVNRTQFQQIQRHPDRYDEGACLVAGGPGRPTGLKLAGSKPTVFADVDNGQAHAQEEIPGRCFCIIPHDGDDDAVRIANDLISAPAGG